MDFAAALAHLDDRIDLEKTLAGPRAGDVTGLSLDRMRALVDVLGDPHRAAPVIHVTGTNGKGSTARMITALLAEHGLSVGTYSSPHLSSVTERIRRNDEPIDERDFAEVVAEIADLESLLAERPSYFDLLTATAFSWFAREAVDVMVIEVGLLGRFDSTNVVEADVAVITNIGRDHTDGSGDWRRAIASEKAGIIDPGSFVVIGETDPELVAVFESEGGAAHWRRGIEFDAVGSRAAIGGRVADLYTPTSRHEEVFVPLHGDHQVANAAAALAAVEGFFARPLNEDVVRAGFATVTMPGRCEVVSRSPLVMLDIAHNPDGTRVLAETVAGEFRPEGPLVLVLGMLGGRDVADTLAPLLALEPAVAVVTTAESPRAVPARELAEVVTSAGVPVVVADRIDAAVAKALDAAGSDGAVVITGSTYVVGAARDLLVRSGRS